MVQKICQGKQDGRAGCQSRGWFWWHAGVLRHSYLKTRVDRVWEARLPLCSSLAPVITSPNLETVFEIVYSGGC